MRRFRIARVAAVACCTAGLVGLSLSGLQAAGATPPRRVPSSPNPSTYNVLNGVSADSASDAWAVGYYKTASEEDKTLILHWNGSSWSRASSPNPGGTVNILDGVTAVSPTNVWAVGQSSSGPLILHWNGAKWMQVKAPCPGFNCALSGVTVSADSAPNAWAVGSYATENGNGGTHTLILHWNGTSWSQVRSPNPSTQWNQLDDVSAPSAKSAWAVGFDVNTSIVDETLILHWNGSKWSRMKSFSASGYLGGVGDASPAVGWAVGGDLTSGDTIILGRNGSTWSAMASPNPLDDNRLIGVSVLSSTSAWAVGSWSDGSGDQYVLIAQLSGTIWAPVPGVNPSTTENELSAVYAVSASDAWAVGSYKDDNTGNTDTLVLHWNGTKWAQQ